MADNLAHASYLMLAPFTDNNFQPGRAAFGSGEAVPFAAFGANDLGNGRPGGAFFEDHAASYLLEQFFLWPADDQHTVLALMPVTGMGQMIRQLSIICQQNQALAVGV